MTSGVSLPRGSTIAAAPPASSGSTSTGAGEFRRIFADLPSSLAFPLWTIGDDGRQRIGFCSDHEDRGQVYSAVVGKRAPSHVPAGTTLRRHLLRPARVADGRQVVYVAGGSLYLLD